MEQSSGQPKRGDPLVRDKSLKPARVQRRPREYRKPPAGQERSPDFKGRSVELQRRGLPHDRRGTSNFPNLRSKSSIWYAKPMFQFGAGRIARNVCPASETSSAVFPNRFLADSEVENIKGTLYYSPHA